MVDTKNTYNHNIVVVWAIYTYFLFHVGKIHLLGSFYFPIAKVVLLCTIIAIAIQLFLHWRKFDKITIFLFSAFYGMLPIVRYITHNPIGSSTGWMWLRLLGLTFVFLVLMRSDFWSKLKGLSLMLNIMILINFFNMLIYPDGYVVRNAGNANIWFLDGKNLIIRTIIPAICIDVMLSYYEIGKISVRSYFLIAISFISVLITKSTTSFLVMLVLFFLLYLSENRKLSVHFNVRNVFLGYIVISLLVFFFNVQELFSEYLKMFFEKDATMTGRVFFYKIAILVIQKSPIFGYAVEYGPEYEKLFENLLEVHPHPHNLLLWLLTQRGIVGLIIYILILNRFSKRSYNKVLIHMTIMYTLYFVDGISESIVGTYLFFPCLALFVPIAKRIELESIIIKKLNA